jgi:hypothetical protein
MAQLVLGLATSHSPQLSTLPELWADRGERDKNHRDLIGDELGQFGDAQLDRGDRRHGASRYGAVRLRAVLPLPGRDGLCHGVCQMGVNRAACDKEGAQPAVPLLRCGGISGRNRVSYGCDTRS